MASARNNRIPLQIFIGLPPDLVDRVRFVELWFRTHEWSLVPGGSHIVVVYADGAVLGYDNVKIPSSYVARICERAVPSRLYLRHYGDPATWPTACFEHVWSVESGIHPADALRAFDLYYQP